MHHKALAFGRVLSHLSLWSICNPQRSNENFPSKENNILLQGEERERGRQNKCKLKYRLKWRCKDKYNFKCKCKIKYRWRCKVQRQIQFQMQMQMLGGFCNPFLVRTCLEAMLYSCIVNCKTPMKASLPKERWLGSLVNLQWKSPSSGNSPIKGGQSKAKAGQGGFENQSLWPKLGSFAAFATSSSSKKPPVHNDLRHVTA